ncbi:MAG: DUF86 domain-containing protein [Actinomycetota bacterium]|nr:DUF86 domain-containing protein [Actinomycetota bacterium]
MSDDQPRDPKGLSSGGQFKPRANPESDLTLDQYEDLAFSRSEEKASRNLSNTLAAMRSTLDKGEKLVDLGRQRFEDDWIVQDAAINTVIQLAEEAKRLPGSYRDERSDVPWHQLIGMRNILTHEYADVDLSTVWTVLRDHFPSLETSLFPDVP